MNAWRACRHCARRCNEEVDRVAQAWIQENVREWSAESSNRNATTMALLDPTLAATLLFGCFGHMSAVGCIKKVPHYPSAKQRAARAIAAPARLQTTRSCNRNNPKSQIVLAGQINRGSRNRSGQSSISHPGSIAKRRSSNAIKRSNPHAQVTPCKRTRLELGR